VCGLLSKPTTLPLPALLLVLDYWPLKRLRRAALLEKVPFFALAGLSAAVTIISQGRAAHVGEAQLMHPLYLPLVMAYCLGFYLSKTVCPTALVSDYPNPEPFGLANGQILAMVAVATVVLVAVVLSVRRTRAWLAGVGFFLLALLPTMGVVRFTLSLAANRSVYFPMLGLLLPLTWGLCRLWKLDVGARKLVAVRTTLAGLGALLVMACSGLTLQYETHWRDTAGAEGRADGTLNLLRYYLTVSPNDWRLHNGLGNEWGDRGDYPSAIVEFHEAVRLHPRWAGNHLSLGRALFMVGRYAEAKRAFANALQRAPGYGRAHLLMGLLLLRERDFGGALAEFRTAAQLDPGQAMAHYHAAEALLRLGRVDEAREAFRRTLQVDPTNVKAQAALHAIMSER
jgi:protein O-mannosyl-transferase